MAALQQRRRWQCPGRGIKVIKETKPGVVWPISGDRDQGNHLTAGVSTQLSSVIMSPADNHLNCCLFSRKPD